MVSPTFKIIKVDSSVMWTPHPLGPLIMKLVGDGADLQPGPPDIWGGDT